jgi:hypothetical protein
MSTRDRLLREQGPYPLYISLKDVPYYANSVNIGEACVGYVNGEPIMLEEPEMESPFFMGFSNGEEIWVE